jgi:WD40 repeat protein
MGLVFTDNGALLGYGIGYSMVRVWDVHSGKVLGPDTAHSSPITGVAFTDDGNRLISVDFDGELCSWDLRNTTEEYRAKLKGGDARLFPYRDRWALTGNARYLAGAGGSSDQVVVWDVNSGAPVFKLNKTESVHSVTLSSDGKLLVGCRSDGTICLWDVRTGKAICRWEGPKCPVWLHLADDNKTLAEVSFHHDDQGKPISPSPIQVCQWDVRNGKLLFEFTQKGRLFHSACLVPSGQVLVVAGREEDGIRLWHMPSGIEIRAFGGGPNYQSSDPTVLSPDGRTLAVAGRDGPRGAYALRLWELASGQIRRELPLDQVGSIMAFSPDGRTLATGCWDTTILLWDLTGYGGEEKLRIGVKAVNNLGSLWSDLTGPDARKSYRASWALTRAPAQTVAFLSKKLRPTPRKPDQVGLINRFIQDLEDDQFAVRENAMRKLETMGKDAQSALQTALKNKPPLELRRRVEALLKKLDGPEPALDLPSERAVEVLEHIGNDEARQLLKVLAAGDPNAPLTREVNATLQRLARTTATSR